MLKMSEWAPDAAGTLKAASTPQWDPNAGAQRKGANGSHIVVYDRKSKRLVEETISPHLILAMRQIYQSRVSCRLRAHSEYATPFCFACNGDFQRLHGWSWRPSCDETGFYVKL